MKGCQQGESSVKVTDGFSLGISLKRRIEAGKIDDTTRFSDGC